MADPAVRLLRLLALLQEHATWTGAELSDRLDVSTRGVRRDVERLRELGYPVLSERGAGGGYRLASGKAMPPLVLDDDEAVAVAVALSTAATGAVEGAGEASARALAKLDQVVPARLRERIGDLRAATVTLGSGSVNVDQAVLTGLARACRDHVRVRFDYRRADGAAAERRLEPYRLVATGRRWYLFAFDLERDDWRVFRLDRISNVHATTFRFTPRPAPDAAEHVARGLSHEVRRRRATVEVAASAEDVRAVVPSRQVEVVPVAGDAGRCRLSTGGDELRHVAAWLGFLPWDLTVVEPVELRDEFAALAARFARAAQ